MALSIIRLKGAEIHPYLEALADLRIRVFRDFPYLYDGEREYERRYLQTYASSPQSFFALALDDRAVVGCATGIPMKHETGEFKQPFIDAGYDPETVFYFGESVLLADYRGRGVGVRFFQEREKYARELGRIRHCCFCAVERPRDHPRRPPGYQPLDAFWTRRGYRKAPELTTRYCWRDLDETEESPKPMTFWLKPMV
jgi:GNAT superfamily N-acetyltransferase